MLAKRDKERRRIGSCRGKYLDWVFSERNKDGTGQELYRKQVGNRGTGEKGTWGGGGQTLFYGRLTLDPQ